MTKWKYFFPDDGEGVDDAREFPKPLRFFDAKEAAQVACQLDFDCHDGCERGENEFCIAIVAPDGEVHKFRGYHEPSVEHRVSEENAGRRTPEDDLEEIETP
jgi:hypothetical protein